MSHPERGRREYPSNVHTDFELHPLTGAFRHPGVERQFLHHHLAYTQAQLRITPRFSACFYIAFALTDIGALG